jgi:NADH pyrophosphatase NudC (nudix superfamily)
VAPLLERQVAVAVLVELGEGLAARCQQFLALDPAVVVLVRAGEKLLLAAFRRWHRGSADRRQHA